MKKLLVLLNLIAVGFSVGYAQEENGYQMPPPSIAELVDAPMVPKIEINEQRTWMAVLHAPRFVDLDFAANPMLGLGGLRINPNTHTLEAELHGFFTKVEITDLQGQREVQLVGLPADLKLGNLAWHPKGHGFAFTNRVERGLELWYADLNALEARQLTDRRLNALVGELLQWHPSGHYVLVQVPANDGKAIPERPRIPSGPVIQESLGKKASSRTYSNLLSDRYDEELFDYFTQSQLIKVYLDGRTETIGQPTVFKKNTFSPDGQYIFVERVERPYSYTLPWTRFPTALEVWDEQGQVTKVIASVKDKSGTRGRLHRWRMDQPSELMYVKSANRKTDTLHRDVVFGWKAPFVDDPHEIVKTTWRFGEIIWGNDRYALLREEERETNTTRWSLFNPKTGAITQVIEERSKDNRYTDPGSFVLENGVLKLTGRRSPVVFTIGEGATPRGERPFLLAWDLMKDQRDTLFKSHPDRYEKPMAFDGRHTLFITRETWDVPPNLIELNLRKNRETAWTDIDGLYPSLAGVSKELMTYMRKDSVELSGTFYLPPGFRPGHDDPLPVVVWAYPREYKTPEAASQVRRSPHRFTELNFRSAVYWVTRGYAVVDMADMPIIAEGEGEPNDGFVEQLILNAEALIDHLEDAGIGDRERVGIGGHSYGAFMTANLLAHSDLFAAGIARSGAYNRTLTPFGFQSEKRTYWHAKPVYDRMSPFTYADKIKAPLLITHGIDDENSGTFPVQSERLYAAIKGNAGTVRLVMFPYEFHGFRARESIMHVLWEQDRWLEKYVKNKKTE